jgi:hypothetical protein
MRLEEHKKIAELFKSKGYKVDEEFTYELQTMTQEYELFQKNESYKSQNEYRLIWFTTQPITNSLNIVCPEAIEYCERIDF